MNEERPIVFTISQITQNFGGLFQIKTKDKRANNWHRIDISATELFAVMEEIAEEFNDNGYAVLFEVD